MDSVFKKSTLLSLVFGLALSNAALADVDLNQPGTSSEMPYLDESFACTSQQKAQQFTRDFNISIDEFGGMELCNGNVDTKKLFNDLAIIEDGKFSATNKEQNVFIKNFFAAGTYYQWMKSQTRSMNRGNDVPYATAYNSWGNFTMQDGWAKLSTLGRVGTVIHEARHTAGYRHVPCRQGPYAGASLDGCDTDYNYGGSHAIEMEYYARVSVLGENFHPVYKQMARLMGIARGNFTFNTSPIRTREGLLLLEKSSRTPVLFDGVNSMDRDAAFTAGVLKRTSFGAVIFNGREASAIEMYEKSKVSHPIMDAYSYFKLLTHNNNPLPVKDFEEFDIANKRYVVQITTRNQIQSYNFPRGNWNNPVNLPAQQFKTTTTLEDGTKGYFLINTQNEVQAFDPNRQSFGSPIARWNTDIVSYANYEGGRLALYNDGTIYQNNKGTWAVWPQATSKYSDMINVPLYDGFEVKR